MMPLLDPSQPLHGQIRDWLRGEILTGRYPPHARLPSEKALMSQFGVSRITVRHALGVLAQEGLLSTVAGKGSFVAPPKPAQALGRLQGFAEAMRDQGYLAHNRVELLQERPASAAVARWLALAEGAPVTEIRRVRHLDGAPVSVDLTYVPVELGRRLAQEDLAGRDIFAIYEQDYGIALGYAELSIDAVAASAELAARLEVAEGAPLIHLERMTYTRDGQPLELDWIHYRGDRFRYRLRVEREGGAEE